MNFTGRCGQDCCGQDCCGEDCRGKDCACEMVDSASKAHAAATAAAAIELRFDMSFSQAGAGMNSIGSSFGGSTQRASCDAILHVVSISDAWSNIFDHRR
jgi:hypothetical protein